MSTAGWACSKYINYGSVLQSSWPSLSCMFTYFPALTQLIQINGSLSDLMTSWSLCGGRETLETCRAGGHQKQDWKKKHWITVTCTIFIWTTQRNKKLMFCFWPVAHRLVLALQGRNPRYRCIEGQIQTNNHRDTKKVSPSFALLCHWNQVLVPSS